MAAHILVVEDEQDIRDLMSFQLKSEGHHVTSVESADRAAILLEQGTLPDLVLLDWMLPGNMSGLDFCKRLRMNPNYSRLPIIMITALTQSENIVAGLDAGADDYITKPFDLEVFQARVRSQLRSLQQTQAAEGMKFGGLIIDVPKCRVSLDKEEISLTSTEFKLLVLMAERPGHVWTRQQFIETIQGENVFVTGRTVDTHIAGLRKKLGPAADLIETIRGIGYRFRDEY